MTTTELIAQGISIVAMAMNLIAYQQKKQKNVMIFQLLGALLFGINFFLLEAWVGGLLSAVAIIRALVFLQRERLHAEHPAWFFGFSAMSVLSYILSFTVLGTPLKISNLIVELLPVIGVIAVNYSYRLKEAKDIRRYGLINSPLWLVYNVWNFSLGAICCESLSLISIGVGILRFDLKRTQKESDGKKPV